MPAVVDAAAAEVPLLDAAAARARRRGRGRGGGHLARADGTGRRATSPAGSCGRGRSRLRRCGWRSLVGKGNNGGDGWAAARRLAAYGAQACASRWSAADGVDTDVASPGRPSESAANRDRWLAAGGRVRRWDLGRPRRGARVAPTSRSTALLGHRRAAARRAGRPATRRRRCSRRAADGRPGRRLRHAVRASAPTTARAADGAVRRRPDRHLRWHQARAAAAPGRGPRGPGRRRRPRTRTTTAGPRAWAALTAGAAPRRRRSARRRTSAHVATVLVRRGRGRDLRRRRRCAAPARSRAGAGLVTVAVPEPVRAEVAARPTPRRWSTGCAVERDGTLSRRRGPRAARPRRVRRRRRRPRARARSRGRGGGGRTCARGARRLVLDADALNVHRDDPDALADHAGALVLTPHERELARIGGGEDGPDAWANRVRRVPDLAARYDADDRRQGARHASSPPRTAACGSTPNGRTGARQRRDRRRARRDHRRRDRRGPAADVPARASPARCGGTPPPACAPAGPGATGRAPSTCWPPCPPCSVTWDSTGGGCSDPVAAQTDPPRPSPGRGPPRRRPPQRRRACAEIAGTAGVRRGQGRRLRPRRRRGGPRGPRRWRGWLGGRAGRGGRRRCARRASTRPSWCCRAARRGRSRRCSTPT